MVIFINLKLVTYLAVRKEALKKFDTKIIGILWRIM